VRTSKLEYPKLDKTQVKGLKTLCHAGCEPAGDFMGASGSRFSTRV